MRVETWAGLKVRIVGGTDREGGGEGPVVVLMHGFGAGGDDLVSLWRVLQVPRDTRFVFPEALLGLPEYGPSARAWWHIDLEAMQRNAASGAARDHAREEPDGLAPAHAAVGALLDELPKRLSAPAERTVLGGFSQGAMLACDVAVRSGRPLAGLALLSGTLIASEAWSAKLPLPTAFPIFQSHGRQDPVLPFAGAVRLREFWQQGGHEVDWIEFNGGHDIPFPVLARLGAFLTRVLE